MKKVYLRAFEPDDYKTTITWRQDEETWSLLGSTRYFVSSEYEKKWIESAIFDPNNIKLAICETVSNCHIGNVYLNNINKIHRTAEIGILIGNKEYRKRGYGTEAVAQIIDYAFNELGLHRLQAVILESNAASKRTFQKIGFSEEGLMRHTLYKNGAYQNQLIMSILSSEYFNHPRSIS